MQPDPTKFWVPSDQKKKASDRLAPTKEKFDVYDGGCLFVVDAYGTPCCNPVNNLCHTIPRSQVLRPLSTRGRVREVFWGFGNFTNLFIQGSEENPVDLSDLETFQPRLIGIDEASCGRFACKTPPIADHDGKFRLIDVALPDFTDPTIAFLVQYRSDLWALFQLKRINAVMSGWDRRIMRQGTPAKRGGWQSKKAWLNKLLPFTQDKVTRLGITWHTDGHSANTANRVVAGQHLHFRSKLTFAACVFYGRSSVASVFPAGGDLHRVGITNFVEDTQQDAEFTNELIESATASMQKNDYGVDVIACLKRLSSGVIAMSPDSYDQLAGAERDVINQWIQQLAQTDAMAADINRLLSSRRGRRNRGKRRR